MLPGWTCQEYYVLPVLQPPLRNLLPDVYLLSKQGANIGPRPQLAEKARGNQYRPVWCKGLRAVFMAKIGKGWPFLADKERGAGILKMGRNKGRLELTFAYGRGKYGHELRRPTNRGSTVFR